MKFSTLNFVTVLGWRKHKTLYFEINFLKQCFCFLWLSTGYRFLRPTLPVSYWEHWKENIFFNVNQLFQVFCLVRTCQERTKSKSLCATGYLQCFWSLVLPCFSIFLPRQKRHRDQSRRNFHCRWNIQQNISVSELISVFSLC